MKILSYLNISNVDDIESDSGYIFNYTIAEECLSRGIQFDVIFPQELAGRVEKISREHQHFIIMGHTKYEVRYQFAWEDVKKIIEQIHPDVFFLNQAELTAHVKALLVEMRLEKVIKIVSYCHYPALHVSDMGRPCIDYSLNNGGLAEDIIDKLYSAVNIADLFFVQSHFAKQLLIDYACSERYKLNKEILILPPPYDGRLIKVPNSSERSNTILYNHRLYDSYGTKEFIRFVNTNFEFNFLVTDPMINRGADRSKFNSSPMENRLSLQKMDNVKIIDGSNRLNYIRAIDSCKVAIAPYRRACVWSMSVIDCFCRGIPVIGPNFAAFNEIIPDFLRYETIKEEQTLIDRLFRDSVFWIESVHSCQRLLKKISPSSIVETLLSDINRIMNVDK